MNQQQEIQIIDVIARTVPYSKHTHYYVVVDRLPKFVYHRGEEEVWHSHRKQRRLMAHDGGFYSFMVERPGTRDAFAGRKFTIALDDGGTLECDGHVWDEFDPSRPEPVVQVGVGTLESLEKCYVFFGGQISAAKLQAWLDANQPSSRYHKYDPQHTIEWLDQRAADNTGGWGERRICAARARKLKKRGVTIRWRGVSRTWYPWYERRKVQLLAELAADGVTP
ncbi:hypothetical protein [Pseudomonas fluorescens]|uniref:hypothetical protein n=1 Tax=Pseudomonas fluorescens TaxID=294 RepID=UPI001CA68663|nr:hypothetical protein [Pseudomonas fluorescens]MBY8934251.1 hypothetical protein [Pseudomonas fluorescens]